jgi:hypothetical protein
LYTRRVTLVVSGGEPSWSTTFCPTRSSGSFVTFSGTGPMVRSGAVSVSTRRCSGVPYRFTVSVLELTNVRSSSQWFESFTNLRSVSG